MPCCPSIIERSRSSQRMSKTEISSDDPLGLEQQQDNRHSRTSSKFGKVILGVTGAAAIGLVLVTTPFVTPALRKICLPYVPATERQISNILLMAQVSKCPGAKLVDLGSGDGRVVCIFSTYIFIQNPLQSACHAIFLNLRCNWGNLGLQLIQTSFSFTRQSKRVGIYIYVSD